MALDRRGRGGPQSQRCLCLLYLPSAGESPPPRGRRKNSSQSGLWTHTHTVTGQSAGQVGPSHWRAAGVPLTQGERAGGGPPLNWRNYILLGWGCWQVGPPRQVGPLGNCPAYTGEKTAL